MNWLWVDCGCFIHHSKSCLTIDYLPKEPQWVAQGAFSLVWGVGVGMGQLITLLNNKYYCRARGAVINTEAVMNHHRSSLGVLGCSWVNLEVWMVQIISCAFLRLRLWCYYFVRRTLFICFCSAVTFPFYRSKETFNKNRALVTGSVRLACVESWVCDRSELKHTENTKLGAVCVIYSTWHQLVHRIVLPSNFQLNLNLVQAG